MLALAEDDPRRTALGGRVRFRHARLPDAGPSRTGFELVLSNSLLHHLADPLDLWRTVLRHAAPGAGVFVMDLLRPESPAAAREMVARYAADEPRVLQHDFHRSLLAAYRVDEVRAQLARVRLSGLAVEVVSDRHWIVHGAAPPTAGRSDAVAPCARRREVG
jgi:2-polyprenyl-3-methyl-5-hydroxy-6-metoxy-1,4-benzoquinol methylase